LIFFDYLKQNFNRKFWQLKNKIKHFKNCKKVKTITVSMLVTFKGVIIFDNFSKHRGGWF